MRQRVSDLSTNAINAAMTANERGLIRTSTPVRTYAANGVFVVPHDMGIDLANEAFGFGYSPLGNVNIWATDTNRRSWTSKLIVLTGSAVEEAYVWVTQRL